MSISKVWLRVQAADQATEIAVIDTQNPSAPPVARGLGSLSVELLPGIYRVRASAGLQIWEKLAELADGQSEVQVDIPLLDFASPIPLPGTAQTREYHLDAAVRESHRVHVTAGRGSAIFVFAGRWSSTDRPADAAGSQNPALGLTLRNLQGNQVANLATQGATDLSSDHDPWAACNVQVDPGVYRLRLQLPFRVSLEQVLIATPGWQTEVFLQQRSYAPTPSETPSERADLAGASILYSRFDTDHPERSIAFDPNDPDFGPSLRLLELARLGLTARRKVLREDITEYLWEKWNNPMLGIFGAHLLLIDPKPDLDLLRRVVGNLRGAIFRDQPHPDVEALALALGPGESTYVFEAPPMLRRGWSLVIDASNDKPDIVPADSLAFEVATRIWGDEPWLLWRNPAPGTQASKPSDQYEASLVAQVAAMEKTEAPAAVSFEMDASGQTKGPIDVEKSARRLSKGLNLPRGNVEALYKKARSKPPS